MHRKSILIHCAVWAIWILINCTWFIFGGVPQPVVPVIYNFAALIVVFYAVRWVAARYWRGIENNTTMWVDSSGDIIVRHPGAWSHYVFRVPVAGVIAIVLAYIGVSWVAEGLFYQWGLTPNPRYPKIYYYSFSRWNVESFYVCAGNVMAAIQYHMRQEQKKLLVLEENNRQQHKEKEFISEQVKGMIDKLNKKNMEIANRLKKG
jgi:hypothetical protein